MNGKEYKPTSNIGNIQDLINLIFAYDVIDNNEMKNLKTTTEKKAPSIDCCEEKKNIWENCIKLSKKKDFCNIHLDNYKKCIREKK